MNDWRSAQSGLALFHRGGQLLTLALPVFITGYILFTYMFFSAERWGLFVGKTSIFIGGVLAMLGLSKLRRCSRLTPLTRWQNIALVLGGLGLVTGLVAELLPISGLWPQMAPSAHRTITHLGHIAALASLWALCTLLEKLGDLAGVVQKELSVRFHLASALMLAFWVYELLRPPMGTLQITTAYGIVCIIVAALWQLLVVTLSNYSLALSNAPAPSRESITQAF